MRSTNARNNGITLVELTVVVAIIAILGMIAYPNFSEYQLRARRMDAKTALQQVANNQERFYISNFAYTNDLTQLGFTGILSESRYYTISVPIANDQGFLAIARPAPGSSQTKDSDCQQFSIDNRDSRSATPDPNAKCW